MSRNRLVYLVFLGIVPACGGGSTGDDGDDTGDDAVDVPDARPGAGHVVYTVGDEVFRIAAEEGAAPENLTDALGAGATDGRIALSPSGEWLVMSSSRYDCGGECLVRVRADLSEGERVLPGGVEVYDYGIAAISDDGTTVVYPDQGGPHELDLFATTRDGAGWTAAVLLTGDSEYAYNNMPAMSFDGTSVVFDCGNQPYPEDGDNDACRVATGGGGVQRLIGPDALPDARFDKVQNPHDGPDGLLFEASWPVAGGDQPEIIWRVTGDAAPEPIGAALPNSVSPCVLPDGRWVALWLGRPGNDAGAHELTVVERDGSNPVVLTPDLDVADIGLGCGS